MIDELEANSLIDPNTLAKEKVLEKEMCRRVVKMQHRLKLVEAEVKRVENTQFPIVKEQSTPSVQKSTIKTPDGAKRDVRVSTRQDLEILKSKSKEQEKVSKIYTYIFILN